MKTGKLEAAATAALFLAPCGAILERCAADGSLFALHPAMNALAFLVFIPGSVIEAPRRGRRRCDWPPDLAVRLARDL